MFLLLSNPWRVKELSVLPLFCISGFKFLTLVVNHPPFHFYFTGVSTSSVSLWRNHGMILLYGGEIHLRKELWPNSQLQQQQNTLKLKKKKTLHNWRSFQPQPLSRSVHLSKEQSCQISLAWRIRRLKTYAHTVRQKANIIQRNHSW